MNNFFKATVAFVFSTLLVCSTSFPERNIVSVSNGTQPEVESVSLKNFYSKAKSKKSTKPVVKLRLTIYDFKSDIWDTYASATGFSVSYDKKEDLSYVVTNHHFCKHLFDGFGSPVMITFERSNSSISYSPEPDGSLLLVDMNESKDLCLLSTSKYIQPAKIAPKGYQIKQMEPVTIVGAPRGLFPVKLNTFISGLVEKNFLPTKMNDSGHVYFLSELIFKGHSGSPVYNKKEEVVGVVFMNFSTFNGPIYGSMAIPLSDLRWFLDKNSIKY